MYKFHLKFLTFFLVIAACSYAESTFSKTRLSNYYSPHFLRLSQIVFGTDEIISQGGYESVEIMFREFDLNGKKVLDIGSGFGGVAM